uniref:LisH domain-containing protein n=1 Tax=Pygocentrus nattereri TaxID=42514 RepID=A0AAR2KDJ3_PYGNA
MAEGGAVPSDVYQHVYSFLLENKFTKAAQEFRKQAKVKPQDQNEEGLLDIFKFWLNSKESRKRKVLTNGPAAVSGPSAKKAKQESSSSEESSSDEDEAPAAKKAPQGDYFSLSASAARNRNIYNGLSKISPTDVTDGLASCLVGYVAVMPKCLHSVDFSVFVYIQMYTLLYIYIYIYIYIYTHTHTHTLNCVKGTL